MTNIKNFRISGFAVGLLAGLVLSAAACVAQPRIVTLGGAVTETVFALGAGSEVVARDMSSVYPKEASALPDVGYFRTIGADGVLSHNPTLILAARGTGPESQVQILENSGVQLLRIDARPSAESALAMITQLGTVLHRETEAARLAADLSAKLATVEQRIKTAALSPGEKVRVAFLIGMGPGTVQAAGTGTAANALIALAGGTNVFGEVSNYKAVSAESLLASDPDVILYGVNPAAPAHTTPAWIEQTRAGRKKRVHPLDLGFHLVFGPRLGDAALELSSLLYPNNRGVVVASSTEILPPNKKTQEGVLRCPVTGKTF